MKKIRIISIHGVLEQIGLLKSMPSAKPSVFQEQKIFDDDYKHLFAVCDLFDSQYWPIIKLRWFIINLDLKTYFRVCRFIKKNLYCHYNFLWTLLSKCSTDMGGLKSLRQEHSKISFTSCLLLFLSSVDFFQSICLLGLRHLFKEITLDVQSEDLGSWPF